MKTGKIHLIGIGGVGMAGLAVLLKAEGYEVSGCDLAMSPRMRALEQVGVRVACGHDADHLVDVDEVVVTPAVRPDNPELVAARVRPDCRVRYRGEVLAEIVSSRESIAVCGSHGKTTTAMWTARLLRALGEDVAWCIGGETDGFPVASPGSGPLVVEADESDGTLVHYRAKTLVVNRLDYDHPDFFRTPADYFACFEIAAAQAGEVIRSEELPPLEGFDFLPPHNRRNARAAMEVALRRGHSRSAILAALPTIVAELPDRRFQKLSEGVYTDYAHHPVEMACAVKMARQVCTGTLRVLFQPHRPSRTKALLEEFPAAFTDADEVILCPTYAAFEEPREGGDIADLYRVCRERLAARLYLSPSCEAAWTHAKRTARPGDVTLVLGAGDLLGRLTMLPPRRYWIGGGTNTWRTDLDLGIEYVQTRGRAAAVGATLLKNPVWACRIPWMVGIPGTIGGWIRMNAGAFGHSFSEVLDAVQVDGVWKSSTDCAFGYRTSAIIGEIQDYRLKPADEVPIDPCTVEVYRARRRCFPAGTFGSFFKNPPGDFAGRLLEAAGAKDLAVGDASVWSEHANVIVRGSNATPSDVLALARLMRNRVFFRFGILLEPEVVGSIPLFA